MLGSLDWNFFTTADLKLSAKHFAPMEYLSELSSVFFFYRDMSLFLVIYLTVLVNVCKAHLLYCRHAAS